MPKEGRETQAAKCQKHAGTTYQTSNRIPHG